MTVYVDNARNPLGRMKMSHMAADTRKELMDMAWNIGVELRHIQHAGTPKEHFDVCEQKRMVAIRAGAVQVTPRQIVDLVRKKRKELLTGSR